MSFLIGRLTFRRMWRSTIIEAMMPDRPSKSSPRRGRVLCDQFSKSYELEMSRRDCGASERLMGPLKEVGNAATLGHTRTSLIQTPVRIFTMRATRILVIYHYCSALSVWFVYVRVRSCVCVCYTLCL